MCKFKVGDKVKTRDGRDVEVVYIDERLKQPIIGVISWEGGDRPSCYFWNEDGSFVGYGSSSELDIIPPSRTVTLYHALVRTMEGRYFSPYDLFSGLDDDEIEDWNSGEYKVIRLLTEYPIEVEL